MKAVLCLLVVLVGAVFADPDGDFASCCKDKSVSDSCQQFCNYHSNPADVRQAFVDGTCSVEKDGPPYYSCLENQKDNTECCKAAGVGADSSLAFCLDICDGSKPLSADQKYFSCKQYEESIMECGKNAHFRKITK